MHIATRVRCFAAATMVGVIITAWLGLAQLHTVQTSLDSVVGTALTEVNETTELQTRFLLLQKTAYQHAVELDVDRMLVLQKTLQTERADIESQLKLLHNHALGDQAQQLDAFEHPYRNWLQVQEQVRRLSEGGDMMKALNLANTQGAPLAENATTALRQMVDRVCEGAREQQSAAQAAVDRSVWKVGAGAGATFLVLLGISLWMTRALVQPLRQLSRSVGRIASEQDFTVRSGLSGNDEIGQVAGKLDSLLQALQNSLNHVTQQSSIMADAVAVTTQAANTVQHNAMNQQEATAQMSDAMQQLTANMDGLHQATAQSRTIAEQCGQLATEGETVISRTVEMMHHVSTQIAATKARLASLLGEVGRISMVGVSIREVADQTNLLALNAAIEAARAGEQGRGFAVVADEVRKLSERTTQSTTGIGELVRAIEREAGIIDDAIQRSVQESSEGATQSQEAGAMMVNMRRAAEQAAENSTHMAELIAQQGTASVQLANHVRGVAAMAGTIHTQAGESASAAGQLRGIAEQLVRIVQAYRL